MNVLLVIPARYASTRLLGKPLLEIAGIPMLSRVWQVATLAAQMVSSDGGFSQVKVVVATEDQRIKDYCDECGLTCVVTSADAKSGTDRAFLTMKILQETRDFSVDFILNLQGDAPFTPPQYISALLLAVRQDWSLQVVTPVEKLSWQELEALRDHKMKAPFSGTTCIVDSKFNARWFSKNILPAIRDEGKKRAVNADHDDSPVWRHVGLYGYSADALEKFVGWPMGAYEALEGLEQLRFLENDIPIRAVAIAKRPRISMSGIDTIQDIELAEKMIAECGDPHHSGEY